MINLRDVVKYGRGSTWITQIYMWSTCQRLIGTRVISNLNTSLRLGDTINNLLPVFGRVEKELYEEES